MSDNTQTFGKLRSFLFPIHAKEFKKFFAFAGIMFCMIMNYTLLRNMKDVLVVNAAGAGVITFLKTYCVTPAAILFFMLFVKLSNKFSRENLFYVIIIPFLAYFLIFGFIINPNFDFFHPSKETIDALHASHPHSKGFMDLGIYWSYSLFYILAELWGSVGIQILFWQFVNQVVSMEQSKRFFPMFVVFSNVSLILVGVVTKLLQMIPDWDVVVKVEMVIVLCIGLFAMFCNFMLNRKILPLEEPLDASQKKAKKKKPGLIESFKIIFTSKHLGFIALLVICYGISINLLEVQWKEQLKNYFAGDKKGMNAFMGTYSACTGVLTIIFGWFLASQILRKFGWFFGAILTPATLLVVGVIFFVLILGGRVDVIKSIIVNPMAVAVFVGAGAIIITKATKYSLFDTTKEQAYIPLDIELKSKGKAAVEVAGGRLGKGSGAAIQSVICMIMGTTVASSYTAIAFGIFIVVVLLWTFAVKGLDKSIKNINANANN
ncbi:MAG: NTP/NDP exchange transporter [Rickettsiales bacterium]|nr:NTP/NDP exchange transporter [Rickettsiales bacterium]